jgi:hypothetical protein
MSAEEAREIAIEAYHYLYPLVLMHVTRRVAINHPPGLRPGLGPEGHFYHVREYSTAGARPGFDTLPSFAWLNLNNGPYLISVPEVHDRYYSVSVYDMWSEVFASLGSHTVGPEGGNFAVVPPRWSGTLPSGVERIESPTINVWVVARTQTNGPKDYAPAHKIQDCFSITALFSQALPFKIDPAVDIDTSPLAQVAAMTPEVFFRHGANLLNIDEPHASDWPILTRLRKIGLESHKPFHPKKAPMAVQAALAVAMEQGPRQMILDAPTIARMANGWQMNTEIVGTYGNNYLKRAITAMFDFGAVPPEDSVSLLNVTAADGVRPSGKKRYVLHFNAKELPPVHAFWSITSYDDDGFPSRNPIHRACIGDRDPLNYNPDGSLDIYVQRNSPSHDHANWLPAPEGAMTLVMRLYAPRSEALDGRWSPPALQRIEENAEERMR